jgi:hypothetical protein
MARNFQREAIDGGDTGAWGNIELAQNRLSLGINTIECYDDAGTLKATVGKCGLVTSSIYGVCHNTAVETISIAGITVSNWFKVEIQRSGSTFTFVVSDTDTGVDTNDLQVPNGFEAAYDPEKGGYYYSSNYRTIAIGYKDAGGNLQTIIKSDLVTREKWGVETGNAVVADAGGAYVDGDFEYEYWYENGLVHFVGWGFIHCDATGQSVNMDITIPFTLTTINHLLITYNGNVTGSDPTSLFGLASNSQIFATGVMLDTTSISLMIRRRDGANLTNTRRHAFSIHIIGTV